MPVKPIAEFGKRWLAFLDRARGPTKIVVIGGGAGGVELALAIDHRLPGASVALATRDEVLAGHARAARKKMRAILARRGIRVVENDAAVGVETEGVRLASGERLAADAIFVVTEATAPHWLAYTGLTLDARGFVALAATLRSSDPRIFAAGDCATVLKHPRPKSGVFAVRQGPPLAENLRRVPGRRESKTLRAAKPLSCADRHGRRSGARDARQLGDRKRLGLALEGMDRPSLDGELPVGAKHGARAG